MRLRVPPAGATPNQPRPAAQLGAGQSLVVRGEEGSEEGQDRAPVKLIKEDVLKSIVYWLIKVDTSANYSGLPSTKFSQVFPTNCTTVLRTMSNVRVGEYKKQNKHPCR